MAKRDNRFLTSYFQDNGNEMIVILKDKLTGIEYLEITSEKGVAVTALLGKADETFAPTGDNGKS